MLQGPASVFFQSSNAPLQSPDRNKRDADRRARVGVDCRILEKGLKGTLIEGFRFRLAREDPIACDRPAANARPRLTAPLELGRGRNSCSVVLAQPGRGELPRWMVGCICIYAIYTGKPRAVYSMQCQQFELTQWDSHLLRKVGSS